jgi:flagellar hook protein FlgE
MALIGSLTSGVSALDSFEQGLEVIGNNVANVNTTGYKDETADYADSFSNMLKEATPLSTSSTAGSTPDTMQIGTGVTVKSINTNFSQGTLTTTGNNTDLGISGSGFFVVRNPSDGDEFVTRDGSFQLDDQGYLVTSQGYRVQGLSDGSAAYTATTDSSGNLIYTQTPTAPSTVGDIKIDFNISIGNGLTNSTGGAFTDAQVAAGAPALENFTVDQAGNVVESLSNGDTFDRGQILMQSFQDPNALVREGNNLYGNTGAAGPTGGSTSLTAAFNTAGTNGLGSVQVGTLEGSNVDLSQEFANLITAQRSFQAASRIITTSDTILDEIIHLKQS